MKLTTLLFTLKNLDVKLSSSGCDRLTVDAPCGKLTPDILQAIKQHKLELLKLLSPCRYCGAKLSISIYPTWFLVCCPTKPVHFLLEEHVESFGATLKAEKELAA